MIDPVLAKKLENYLVPLPNDYRGKITELCAAKGLAGLDGPIIDFIDKAKGMSSKELNAGQIAGIIMTMVMKMIEQGPTKFTKEEIISAIDLGPEILSVIITNEQARRDAATFYWNEMMGSRNHLASFK
jgi:hypothetical protein